MFSIYTRNGRQPLQLKSSSLYHFCFHDFGERMCSTLEKGVINVETLGKKSFAIKFPGEEYFPFDLTRA